MNIYTLHRRKSTRRNVDNFFAIVDDLAEKHNINPKYKHVIFTSGRQDLAALTGDLLKRNRDILL